jgi:hypothetical protein
MPKCRFLDLDDHVCVRRDGRIIHPSDETPCWYDTRAAVIDEAALAVEVDTVARPLVRSLLLNRAAWGGEAA